MEDKQAFYSVKGQEVNILGFIGHIASGIAIQLCSYSTRAVIDNTKWMDVSEFQYNCIYKSRGPTGIGLWSAVCWSLA